jgi:hypothetical protein
MKKFTVRPFRGAPEIVEADGLTYTPEGILIFYRSVPYTIVKIYNENQWQTAGEVAV